MLKERKVRKFEGWALFFLQEDIQLSGNMVYNKIRDNKFLSGLEKLKNLWYIERSTFRMRERRCLRN